MSLYKYEFNKALQDYKLGFTEGKNTKLFTYFDYDRSGLFDYGEFIRTIITKVPITFKKEQFKLIICSTGFEMVLEHNFARWFKI